ncbi:MAG: uracil-DNA glycosylase [Pseudomonadota bacterium]
MISQGDRRVEQDLADLLHFYADAGVDCVLEDKPVNRFHKVAAAVRNSNAAETQENSRQERRETTGAADTSKKAEVRQTSQPTATVPDESAISDAREAARSAPTIEALREALLSFEGCNLRFGARSTVFADGNPEAAVMFIGEAPGRDEDRLGLPFVGRAGQLLDRMLAAIGLDRTSCYITNMIPWRPPGNRAPTPLEIELCKPFIERHVELVSPKIIVLLGNVSTKALLGTTRGILSLRGTWSQYNPNADINIPALPTLHPAYLLRSPAQKKLSWQDFQSLRARLDGIAENPPQ